VVSRILEEISASILTVVWRLQTKVACNFVTNAACFLIHSGKVNESYDAKNPKLNMQYCFSIIKEYFHIRSSTYVGLTVLAHYTYFVDCCFELFQDLCTVIFLL
jgi:hypothetical protein